MRRTAWLCGAPDPLPPPSGLRSARRAVRIAVLKERRPAEARVAASPDTVKKMVALGWQVAVEAGAGGGATFADAAYEAAGASLAPDAASAVAGAAFVLKVQRPLGA